MIMQCVCADFDTQCVNKLLWLSVFVCAHHIQMSLYVFWAFLIGCRVNLVVIEPFLIDSEQHYISSQGIPKYYHIIQNEHMEEVACIWVLVSHMV